AERAGPAGAARAPARYASAAGHPCRQSRGGGHLGGPGQGRGRAAGGRLRQRRAAPGFHPRPRAMARARGAAPGGRARRPPGCPAVRYSYPRWIVGAYRDALGDPPREELEAALAAGDDRPRVTMAVLPGGPGREEVMPEGAEPSRWSPYGFTLPGGDPAGL